MTLGLDVAKRRVFGLVRFFWFIGLVIEFEGLWTGLAPPGVTQTLTWLPGPLVCLSWPSASCFELLFFLLGLIVGVTALGLVIIGLVNCVIMTQKKSKSPFFSHSCIRLFRKLFWGASGQSGAGHSLVGQTAG